MEVVIITNSRVLEIMQNAIMVAVKLAAPLLLLSMAIGILISIIQAATQIHEQTITFVPKVILIVLIMIAAGSWMLETLQGFTYEIFQLMLEG